MEERDAHQSRKTYTKQIKLSESEVQRLLLGLIGDVSSETQDDIDRKRKRAASVSKNLGNNENATTENVSENQFGSLNPISLQSTPTKIRRDNYPSRYIHYDKKHDVIFDSGLSGTGGSKKNVGNKDFQTSADHANSRVASGFVKNTLKIAGNRQTYNSNPGRIHGLSSARIISLKDLYSTIVNTEGLPLEECYKEYDRVLNIHRRKKEYDRKTVLYNINHKIRTLPNIHTHLRFYGESKDFSLERLRRFPEILLNDGDPMLRKQFLTTKKKE